MASETTGEQVEQAAPVSDAPATQVQEQPTAPTPVLTPEQIQAALSSEEARRRIQSEVDKARAKLQADALRLQREEAQRKAAAEAAAAEERELSELDDAEYGQRMRQKRQEQEAAQAQAALNDQTHYNDMMSLLPSEEQTAIFERAQKGEFKTRADFYAAIADRRAELRTPKQTEVIREAARREATAEVANTGNPTLGTSLPRQPVEDLSKKSSLDLIADGWKEQVDKKLKGR
jgi:hypothetical protein